MATDKIIVERETCGALCGRHCKYVDDDNAGCALFDAPMVWHSEGRYKRCPACLSTPSARVLTEEMMEAVNEADILAEYIDNPLAWEVFDQGISDAIAEHVEKLRAAFGIEEATK